MNDRSEKTPNQSVDERKSSVSAQKI